MNYKLYILKTDLREYGFSYVLKRVISYLLRPLTNLMQRSIFLVNLWYGVLPNLREKLPFGKSNPKFIKFPQTDLVKRVREFWYGNIPGNFDLDGEKISRKDIFTYGGPNPKFTCPICQKSEWLSRLRQKNLFTPHSCFRAKECEELCKKQSNELWTHYHQNFDFAIGCDSNLPAPKCLFLLTVPNESYSNFFTPYCDYGKVVGRRRFAYAFQMDVVQKYVNINWVDYDFLWLFNEGNLSKFHRPNIPIILYGHDFWPKNKGFQWMIDWVRPDIFLTSYPTQWQENFKFPSQTKIAFYPLFSSSFLTRSNLDEKKLDLLVIGTTANPIYKPRLDLNQQIYQWRSHYKIEFSHHLGALKGRWGGSTEYSDEEGNTVRYLNKWSEYLGFAKYVIFGKIGDPNKQFLLGKYYETLGSGAIPIFPEVPDLKLLGVKPFEHYIPLSEVEGRNERLRYFLDNYNKFKYIAQNGVEWYKENSDKMLFEDFENLIRDITNYKYPKRLI